MAATTEQFVTERMGRFRLPPTPFRLPGVYRPQADTHLLASVVAGTVTRSTERVLDICTGTGAVALTAALAGRAAVTAVDISRRAVLSVRLNALRCGARVRARRMSFVDLVAWEQFDLVVANPPYVPCDSTAPPKGRDRCWDAGPDGRALLDPLCAAAPRLLAPGGTLLLVQSDVSGVDLSVERLRSHGLRTAVVARCHTPFGPVMHARAEFLERTGRIAPGRRHEELVVIRADRV